MRTHVKIAAKYVDRAHLIGVTTIRNSLIAVDLVAWTIAVGNSVVAQIGIFTKFNFKMYLNQFKMVTIKTARYMILGQWNAQWNAKQQIRTKTNKLIKIHKHHWQSADLFNTNENVFRLYFRFCWVFSPFFFFRSICLNCVLSQWNQCTVHCKMFRCIIHHILWILFGFGMHRNAHTE